MYDSLTALLAGISPADLQRRSRCAGWTVGDVLVHLLGDAERALVACATPAPGPPTVDAAGYFRAWNASPDRAGDGRSAWFTRIVASA